MADDLDAIEYRDRGHGPGEKPADWPEGREWPPRGSWPHPDPTPDHAPHQAIRMAIPRIVWVGSPNYTSGREGHDLAVMPSWVFHHTTVGDLAGAIGRFQDSGQQVSAHYIVDWDGTIYQVVKETDIAWHSGTWPKNVRSVGIEHVDRGNYNAARPDALYASSAWLTRQICTRWGIPIQRGNIVSVPGCLDHRQNFATDCPDALDTNRIIAMAAAPASPPVHQEASMKVYSIQGDPTGSLFATDGLFRLHIDQSGDLDSFFALQASRDVVPITKGAHLNLIDARAFPSPVVDVDALATALAPHLPPETDPAVIAKAVAQELGKAITTGA